VIAPQDIVAELARMTIASERGDAVRVSTHCLYPSNSTVSVMVRGGPVTFTVSDDGGATGEMISAGLRVEFPNTVLRRAARRQGLKAERGVIFSPPVPIDALGPTILLVANVSKDAADWALGHLRFTQPRDFRENLAALLGRYFHDRVQSGAHFIGASNKSHKFGYSIRLHGDRRLLIDPVVNEASSINSCVVANLDVKLTENPAIEQLIVWDDQLAWKSSDLKLLEVGRVPTIPFSLAEPEIKKRAA